MSTNGWVPVEYQNSSPGARMRAWMDGGVWSADLRDFGDELVAENLRAFATAEEAMKWAESIAAQLMPPLAL